MWPQENPWPLIVLFLLGAMTCVILWSQHRRRQFLIGVFVMLLLAVAAWVFDLLVQTPREGVERALRGIVQAFEDADHDRTVSFISNRAPDLRDDAETALDYVKAEGRLRVTDVRIELSNQDSRAQSRFRVNGTVAFRNPISQVQTPQHEATLWEAKWQLERGDWKMLEIHEFNPITGEAMDRIKRLKHSRQRAQR